MGLILTRQALLGNENLRSQKVKMIVPIIRYIAPKNNVLLIFNIINILLGARAAII